jgi:DNA-binding transcriptional MerR regulator
MSTTPINLAIEQSDTLSLIDFLEDKALPIEDVRQIYDAFKDNKQLVGQVAMNLSLRTSVYEREQEYSPIMVDLLIDISQNPIDMGARWAVAKNPHTPVEVLRHLANDSINLVRALVATNPSTPSDVLEKFFSDEKIVRDGLSGNPNTSPKLLKILVDDSDKMVRMRLAENRGAPIDIIKSLLNDNDIDVTKAAQANLDAQS